MSVAIKIAEIKNKLKNSKLNDKLRAALTEQLKKLEKEASKSNTKADPFKKAAQRRKKQGLSTSRANIKKDADRPALPKGKRVSKNGNVYYENRDNRIDIKQPPKTKPKLEGGGIVVNDVNPINPNPRVELFKKGGKVGNFVDASKVAEIIMKDGTKVDGSKLIYGLYCK